MNTNPTQTLLEIFQCAQSISEHTKDSIKSDKVFELATQIVLASKQADCLNEIAAQIDKVFTNKDGHNIADVLDSLDTTIYNAV